MSKPEQARYERVRAFDTNNELFITRKTRILIEIVFLTQIKNKNSRTWNRKLAINSSRSVAPIFSVSLSSFLETKFFFEQ